jgi:multiple antibiotic resistance protein
MFNLKEILSVTLILFAVIDMLGNIPVVIEMRQREGVIQSGRATLVAAVLMIGFLFLGQEILKLFGLDAESFALAGAIIIFLVGMEMVLGIHLFQANPNTKSGSIVPLAFPMIVGAGTMTTLLSLRAVYALPNILAGIIINLLFVYLVLKGSGWLEQKLGQAGTDILRKVFGVILLAIAIKIFKSNLHF